MRILLIAPSFYPDTDIGAARWNRLAKYLRGAGHELYVVTSDMLSRGSESPLADGIVRVDFRSSVVDSLMAKISRAKRDLPVERQRRMGLVSKPSRLAAMYGALIATAGKLARFPSVHWWSANTIVRAGLHLMAEHSVDAIVATHPNAVSLRAGRALSARTGVPWVADMRDGWSSYYFGEYSHGSIYYRILRRLERRYLRSAARVVSINPTLAETLQADPDKVVVLPNVFDPAARREHSPTNSRRGPFRFAFAGSVHESHAWNLLFDAVAELPPDRWRGRLRVDYYGGYHHVVERKLLESGVQEELVVNHGYVDQVRLRDELAAADALLVFGFSGAFGDSVTTGKIFDYIEVGKPIVVLGPGTSELARLVTRTGVGVVLSDVPSVSAGLERVLDDPAASIEGVARQVDERALAEASAPEVARRYVELLSEVSAGT